MRSRRVEGATPHLFLGPWGWKSRDRMGGDISEVSHGEVRGFDSDTNIPPHLRLPQLPLLLLLLPLAKFNASLVITPCRQLQVLPPTSKLS